MTIPMHDVSHLSIRHLKKFPVDGVVVIIVSALSLRDKEILSDRPCS